MPEIIRKYKDKSQVFIKEKFTDDGAGWLMLRQIVIAPMSIFTTFALAKILSISDYGYYKYVLSSYGVIALFGFIGVYNITALNIQKGEINFFYLGLKYKKILRWIPALISLCISAYYFYNSNTFLGSIFLLTIFSHVFLDFFDTHNIMTSGRGNFKLNFILAILDYFFSYFPPLVIAYFTRNLLLIFFTMYISQFFFRFFAFSYTRKKLGFLEKNKLNLIIKENEIKNYKKEIAANSLNIGLTNAGVNMSSMLVFNRLGAESNAIYSLALTFADFVGGIIASPLSKTIFILSNMTKNGNSDSKKILYIRTLFRKYFLLSLFGVLICFLVLPFIYKFLFAKYFFSYKYAIVYSLSILAISLAPTLSYLTEKRMYKFINLIQIASLTINLISLFFATTYFGIWGAIVVAILIKYITNISYTIGIKIKK